MNSLRCCLAVAVLTAAMSGCSSSVLYEDKSMYLTGTEELPGFLASGEPSCREGKVLVCHIPPGNPGNAHTICVGAPAVKAHEGQHGDSLGACTLDQTGCDSSELLTRTETKPVKTRKAERACTGHKVLICHIPPGNPANAHSICVDLHAQPAHLRNHGDALGECPVEDETPPTGEACEAPGQACTTSAECSTNICVAGTCKSPTGAPCDMSTSCASGICINTFCEGAPPTTPCTQNAQCASELCAEGACAEGLPPGAACTDPGQCSSDTCTNGVCSPNFPEGTPCVQDDQCSSTECVAGFCEGGAAPGSPCTAAGECVTDSCVAGVCAAPLPDGAPCTTKEQCASEACVAGFCEGGLPGGSACTNDQACASEACVDGACAPGAPGGSACTVAADCASQICVTGLCQGGGNHNGDTCTAAADCISNICSQAFCEGGLDGSACVRHEQCGSGLCDSGQCMSIIIN